MLWSKEDEFYGHVYVLNKSMWTVMQPCTGLEACLWKGSKTGILGTWVPSKLVFVFLVEQTRAIVIYSRGM